MSRGPYKRYEYDPDIVVPKTHTTDAKESVKMKRLTWYDFINTFIYSMLLLMDC